MRRSRLRGFTIAEILITIAIISIAFLGTMAALAFGMTATRDTAQHTTALNYNRRMIELLYSKPSIYSGGGITEGPPAPVDAPRDDPQWKRLYYLPDPSRTLPSGVDAWFELSDWYRDATTGLPSNDAKQFMLEEHKYQVNIVKQAVDTTNPSTNPATAVFRVIVTTRWSEKVGVTAGGSDRNRWRFMRTEAGYVE